MRVNAQDIVSKETQASSRNLLVVASSVLVVHYFDYNSKDWDLLGRSVAPADFNQIALLLLTFLVVNHLIKWYSDYYLYRKWFSMNEVPAGGMDEIGKIGSSHGPIKGLAQRLKWLTESLDQLQSASSGLPDEEAAVRSLPQSSLHELQQKVDRISSSADLVSESVGEVNKLLHQLDKRFDRVSLMVRFVIFGWYLALPMTVCFVAWVSALLEL